MKKPKNHHETSFIFDVFSGYIFYVIFTGDIQGSLDYVKDRDYFTTSNAPHDQIDGLTINVSAGASYILLDAKTPS